MKKYILFLIPFLIGGCQKEFNNTVDVANINDIQVKSVAVKDSVTYSITDSLMNISIAFTSSDNLNEVYCDVFSPDGNQMNNQPIQLFDNGNIDQSGDTVKGDNKYSNLFPLRSTYSTGLYKIQFFIVTSSGTSQMVAVHYFLFNTGTPNVAPVISNLVAPDTLTIGSTNLTVLITLNVQDGNGLSDIQSVYFNSYIPPNGNPASSNPYLMYDNGLNGDQTAGDGIYSILITLPSTGVTTGTYRWEFFAKDKSNALSNKITHYVVVK